MVFYTQNGWAGSNYDSNLSMVDICKKIREFCKQFKGYKFSVRKRDYSCLIIDLKESPFEITNAERMYNFFANEKASGLGWRNFWIDEKNLEWSDLTEEQKQIVSKDYAESWCKYHQLNGNPDCDWLNPEVKEVLSKVYAYMQSFNYDDSDGMIDYFNCNFYHYLHIDTK